MSTSTFTVTIHAEAARLTGDLAVPRGATDVVVFVHGSGSNRASPRNQYVANELRRAGLATLLFDLLTPAEDQLDRITSEFRFDIPLLADRVGYVLEWIETNRAVGHLPVGLFGASTGAAAALMAAPRAEGLGAIVSRGGRPELAGAALAHVRIPTLMIVGSDDGDVLALNRDACKQLGGPCAVHVVAGAGHLFEEPGALDEVIQVTTAWFRAFLPRTPGRRRASAQPAR